MDKNAVILKRQKVSTWFKNGDMDFTLNWILGVGTLYGLAPSQILGAVQKVKDGDPVSWCRAFSSLGAQQAGRADGGRGPISPAEEGQARMGACLAYRAALQFGDVAHPSFRAWAGAMEQEFQAAARCWEVPLRPVEIPYGPTTLPGYFLEQDGPAPTLLMVGGGDTFREDLFSFAGYPGWKRGYNVLMVDLPGQGLVPDRGLPFAVDMAAPLKTVVDWWEMTALHPGPLAIYGVSGGGYFSAQAVASDRRIGAWVAATPIFDVAEMFRREFGAAARVPGWLLSVLARALGRINDAAGRGLRKYAWQFGTEDFQAALARVEAEARPVDPANLSVASLFFVSEGEGAELVRQTEVLTQILGDRGVPVTRIEFLADEGADGHCQVNNLRLAHLRIFDWLDARFGLGPRDSRLVC